MPEPYYADDQVSVYSGDCLDVLAELPDSSVDSVVTDPPYGLEFMGKDWDAPWKHGGAVIHDPATERGGFQDGNGGNPYSRSRIEYGRGGAASVAFQLWCQQWATECLRLLKPGGHLLAFGGTRTWHRLAAAIEDAGFEIRDSIAWLYGSGFPKSLNLPGGLGTALKPAHEPIVMARKPICGTVAANVVEHGTGALNIDACRVAHDDPVKTTTRTVGKFAGTAYAKDAYSVDMDGGTMASANPAGRWPTNVVIDEHTAAVVDEQTENRRVGAGHVPATTGQSMFFGARRRNYAPADLNDGKGAARFFPTFNSDVCGRCGLYRETCQYCMDAYEDDDEPFPTFKYQAKADTSQRPTANGVSHPTVKPLDLMRWLVRLVTPPNGVVLDPFAGSGTTAEACVHEYKCCITIEREPDYLPLIVARLSKPMAVGFDFDGGAA